MPTTQTVTIRNESLTLEFVIGRKDYKISTQKNPLTLPIAPYLSSAGRTMIPLKGPLEAMGYTVGWNRKNTTVYVMAQEPVKLLVESGLNLRREDKSTGNPDLSSNGIIESLTAGTILTAFVPVKQHGDGRYGYIKVISPKGQVGWIAYRDNAGDKEYVTIRPGDGGSGESIDDNLRLKAEIMELFTEVCDSVNSKGGRIIEPWVLLGMWAQEDGTHVKSGSVINYFAGSQNSCVYKSILMNSINVSKKSTWGNGVTWGDGKTGLILNANSNTDGLKIGNGAILSGGSPYVNHAVGPFQFEPIYFIGNKNTNDYKQNYIFNSKHISTYSDFSVGQKSLVNEQLNWGGLNNLQKKDSKLGALIGHDIYRPHVAYLPDSAYNACMILYNGANSYKKNSGIELLADYSTLTEEGKKYVDYAFALISHNAWTTNAKNILPKYIDVQKNRGLLSWANNPPDINAAVQIIGGSADFAGYGLTCMNYGKFLWDKWTEEVKKAVKSSHSHVN